MTAKAIIEIHDTIRVWIEFRAPKRGELAWGVPADLTIEEALDHVLVGRDDGAWPSSAGFGYVTAVDRPEFEYGVYDQGDCMRNVVVHVERVRTTPGPADVAAHIKLL